MILDWTLGLVSRFPLFVMGIVFIVVAKWAFQRIFGDKDVSKSIRLHNPAYASFLASFLLALGLAMSGSFLMHIGHPSLHSLLKAVVEGLLSVCLLWCSIWMNDRFILFGFKIQKEIHEDKNLGVAFCVAGSTLATGCILNGAFIGYSPSFLREVIDVVAFWGLGQIMLCSAAFIYRRFKTYDVHKLIEFDDNIAVGLDFGGLLLAIGIVVRAGIVGSGQQSLVDEWLLSLMLIVIGIMVLLLVYVLIGRYLSSGLDVRNEIEMRKNVALGCLQGGGAIAIALFIAALIQR